MTGCVHIYCGDGKGKTTAALGLAMRAVGRGFRVLLVRFLKNDDSGELIVLETLPNAVVFPCERSFSFTFQMSAEQKAEAAVFYDDYFERASRLAMDEDFDLVIFDELMAACNHGMVREAAVLNFLAMRPKAMEVVMTGRNPSAALAQEADYISEIKMVKHPFTQGIPARVGIEY